MEASGQCHVPEDESPVHSSEASAALPTFSHALSCSLDFYPFAVWHLWEPTYTPEQRGSKKYMWYVYMYKK